MTVGDNIKQIRLAKKLTQKELGELCKPKMADSAIRRYENGKANPKLETVRRIAVALDVTISDLVVNWNMFTPGEIFEDISDNEVDYAAIDPRAAAEEQRILKKYRNLNTEGKDEAVKRVDELTQIPKYQKDKK
ncbi:helix-turn-helix transcriptional regulator [Muricomes intestini]|uniref:helix-turn-helix domain-containing protein n=1 Tax=Muricomes intestini TaxID=1796634 RepID=UPI002FDD888C